MSGRSAGGLREAWEASARQWLAWVRAPGHDTYGRFHRRQFLELVPPPGRLTVDIGCGEGRLARDLKALGHTVVGIDSSRTLIAAARDADPAIPFHVAEASALPVGTEAADLAVAFMSLHDIDDMAGAVREAGRVVRRSGCLCLAIVHPINSAGGFETSAPESPFVVTSSYFDPRRYTAAESRRGLTMTFSGMHRPLEAYFGALEQAGFLVETVREPTVPESAVSDPGDRRWRRVPLFLHVRARRV